MAKNFGALAQIVSDLNLAPAVIDTEDRAVGHSGLPSHRDRAIVETFLLIDSTPTDLP